MDPRLVRKFIRRFHLALLRLEYFPISSIHGATCATVFHLRSRHFPSWFSQKEVAMGESLNVHACEYLREHIQRQLCFESDRSLRNLVIKRIIIGVSRPIPVIGWDKYETSESAGCACLFWPVYLPLYCLPHILMDITRGREYLFTIHFNRESLGEGVAMGAPSRLGGFIGHEEF